MRDSVRRFFVSTIALTFADTLLLGSAPQASAATVAYAGFEDSGDTWLGASISGVGGSFAGNRANQTPLNSQVFQGSKSFQSSNGTSFVDFNPVDVSAFDSIQITIRVSSTSATANNGNDSTDYVKLYVALNGSAFAATPDITLFGAGNATWGYDGALTGTTAAGTPKTLNGSNTNQYSTIVITIPNSATSVDFRIEAMNDNAGEFWNIDAVTITGTAVPEPSVAMSLIGGVGMLLGLRRMRRLAR